MTKVLELLFGSSWKSSLIGLGAGLITAGVTYAQAQPQPGWYIVAFALAALGRVTKDAGVTNSPTPAPATRVGTVEPAAPPAP